MALLAKLLTRRKFWRKWKVRPAYKLRGEGRKRGRQESRKAERNRGRGRKTFNAPEVLEKVEVKTRAERLGPPRKARRRRGDASYNAAYDARKKPRASGLLWRAW